MFKLGNIEVKGKVILAPMAGYTSLGYRNFMNPFGVALCYTEMVSDMGLIYGNKETISYIDFPKGNVPTGIQLFGSEPDNLAKALQICESNNPNADFYDVNMACPVTKVVKTGAGSALLKDPKKCGDIIRALKCVTNKPITAKIRLGFDNNHINFREVIHELEDAGVSMIAIHARTAKDLYCGLPRFEEIKNLRDEMKVPLVVSGNIYTVDDAINALNITKADAVMVARGGVGNPYLITNINNHFEGKDMVCTSLKEQCELCIQLAKDLIEEKGEIKAMRVFRSMSSRFFANFANSKEIRCRLSTEVIYLKDLENILREYLESFK